MLPQLSQDLLDQLAAAWSRLDQARPATLEEVPQLTNALVEWMNWAIRVDDELTAILSASCPALPSTAGDGATALRGLRHVQGLLDDDGRHITELISISAGFPPVFHEAIWLPFEELPSPRMGAPIVVEESAYRRCLEGSAARTSAAAITRFLLDVALDRDGDRVEVAD